MPNLYKTIESPDADNDVLFAASPTGPWSAAIRLFAFAAGQLRLCACPVNPALAFLLVRNAFRHSTHNRWQLCT